MRHGVAGDDHARAEPGDAVGLLSGNPSVDSQRDSNDWLSGGVPPAVGHLCRADRHAGIDPDNQQLQFVQQWLGHVHRSDWIECDAPHRDPPGQALKGGVRCDGYRKFRARRSL
jgi:hypothetical protein